MQLINNRYRVLREIDSVTFTVRDMEDHTEKIIRVIDGDLIDANLRDFFTEEYDVYKNITAPEIVKSLDFGVIRHIDGIKNQSALYFMLSEYTDSEPVIGKIKPAGNAALKMFADACRGIYYLHLKNITHGDICPETIHMEEGEHSSVLRLRSLSVVEMWRRGKNVNLFFKAPESAFGENTTPASDIYSLGVLLFKLACESEEDSDFATAYNAYKDKFPNGFTSRLFPFIDRMTASAEERYKSVKDILDSINGEFKTDFKAFDPSVLAQINPTVGFVGYSTEKAIITEEFDKTAAGTQTGGDLPGARCVCVHGGYGVGLTALLGDLVRKWKIQGRAVYSALGTPDESFKDLLKQLLEDYDLKSADKGIIRQVNALINGAGTEGFSQNLLLKFMYDCIKDSPAAFVIDSAHLAGAEIFKLLGKLMEVGKKVMLVIAYRTDYENPSLASFLNSLPGNHTEVLMRPLNEDETAQFLQRKLSLTNSPVLFAAEVYGATQGNPLFISEILKSLQLSGVLSITESGRWHIDFDDSFGYSRLPIPSTITQISSDQAVRLTPGQKIFLKTLSVFTTPVSVTEIAECSGLSPEEVLINAKACEAMGYVRNSKYRDTIFYSFDFKILKDYLYDRLDPSEKTNAHKTAANILRKRNDGAFFTEIVYHMEKAGIRDAVLASYYTEIGKRLMSVSILQKAAENFEKALTIPGCDTVEVLLNLGRAYTDSGNVKNGGECLSRAAKLAADSGDLKYRVNALYRAVGAEEWILSDLLQIFADNAELKDEMAEEYFGTLNAQARAETDEAKSIGMYKSAYIHCPEELYDIRAGLILGWGHAEYLSGDAREAARVWEAARPFMYSLTNMRNLTSLLNNLSGVAQANDDFDVSKQIITEGIDLCKQHGLLRNQSYLLISLLDCHFKCAELEKTLPLAREIAQLEKIQNVPSDWHLFRACLYTDRYAEAYGYAVQLEKSKVKIGRYSGIGEFDPSAYAEYLSGRARFALYMNDDAAALTFLNMEEAECKSAVTSDYTAKKYRAFYDASIAMKTGNNEGIVKAYNDFLMHTGLFWQRQETLFHLAEFLIFLNDGGGLKALGSKFDEAMERINRGASAAAVNARYLYLLSLTKSGDEKLKCLRETQKLAKTYEQPLLLVKSLIALGEHYKSTSRYHSYYFYSDANKALKLLLENVPVEFHEGFTSRHNLTVPAEALAEDASVWMSAHKAHFERLPEKIETAEDVLSAVGSDAYGNLSLVVKFLAAVAHAGRAEIIINDKNDFEVIASDDGDLKLNCDRRLIKRVQALDVPYLSAGVSEGVMCVPAALDNTVLGYIYLYAGHRFHNFNGESLDVCRCLAPLVAFNINQIKVKDSAFIDRLTGAFNTKAFDICFDRVLGKAREYGHVFSVILCDLDRFKAVNDTFGHQTGDDLLRAVGKIFRTNIPPNAVFGRVGGDEFAIVLDGLDADEAPVAAEKLRSAVADAMLLGSKRPVTVSMGISTYGRDGDSKTELMEKADKALYICKERGRNGCVQYAPDFGGKTHYVNFTDGIVTSDALRDGERMRFILSLLGLLQRNIPAEEKRRQMLNDFTEILHAETGVWLNADMEGAAGRVYDKSTAVRAAETREWVLSGDGARSSLYAPIICEGDITGVICIHGRLRDKPYNRDDGKYLQYLCGFAAAVKG